MDKCWRDIIHRPLRLLSWCFETIQNI